MNDHRSSNARAEYEDGPTKCERCSKPHLGTSVYHADLQCPDAPRPSDAKPIPGCGFHGVDQQCGACDPPAYRSNDAPAGLLAKAIRYLNLHHLEDGALPWDEHHSEVIELVEMMRPSVAPEPRVDNPHAMNKIVEVAARHAEGSYDGDPEDDLTEIHHIASAALWPNGKRTDYPRATWPKGASPQRIVSDFLADMHAQGCIELTSRSWGIVEIIEQVCAALDAPCSAKASSNG